MTLTKTERILLISSLQTLKAQLLGLKAQNALPEDEDMGEPAMPTIQGCNFAIEVLERGFSVYYPQLTSAVGATFLEMDEMPHEECVFTLDVLEMFRQILDYRERHPDDKAAKSPLLNFAGFDGNYEGEYAALAEFTVRHREYCPELGLKKPQDFVTHCPMIPRYRGMVERWRASLQRARLTGEDVAGILKATAETESNPEISCVA